MIRSVDLHLLRLYEALKQKLRSQPLVHGDETWVQVLKEDGRGAHAKSFMWAYRSGQDSEQPIVVFDYQPGRGRQHPQAFLGDYRGLLMSDGYDASLNRAMGNQDLYPFVLSPAAIAKLSFVHDVVHSQHEA